MTYAVHGIDVSHWQGAVDMTKAIQAGAVFCASRATVGNYYTDPTFAFNYAAAVAAGMPFMAYHVVKPSNSVASQMARFGDLIDNMPEICGVILDCEVNDGKTPTVVTSCIRGCLSYLDDEAIIYTRASWWNVNVLRSTLWSAYPLWIANYTDADAPMLPLDWSSWLIWQYSADGNGQGAIYGVQSDDVDLNWFNGSLGEFEAYFDVEAPGHIEPPPPSACLKMQVQTATLNVRTGPSTSYPVVSTLQAGAVVDVLDVAGANAWIEIAPGRWACVKLNSTVYMRKVS